MNSDNSTSLNSGDFKPVRIKSLQEVLINKPKKKHRKEKERPVFALEEEISSRNNGNDQCDGMGTPTYKKKKNAKGESTEKEIINRQIEHVNDLITPKKRKKKRDKEANEEVNSMPRLINEHVEKFSDTDKRKKKKDLNENGRKQIYAVKDELNDELQTSKKRHVDETVLDQKQKKIKRNVEKNVTEENLNDDLETSKKKSEKKEIDENVSSIDYDQKHKKIKISNVTKQDLNDKLEISKTKSKNKSRVDESVYSIHLHKKSKINNVEGLNEDEISKEEIAYLPLFTKLETEMNGCHLTLKRQKNKDTKNKNKLEPSPQTNFTHSQNNISNDGSKRTSKEKFTRKSDLYTEIMSQLSPITKSAEESIRMSTKKRKHLPESSDTSSAENILHKLKKVESSDTENSSLLEFVTKIPSDTTPEHKSKKDKSNRRELFADISFAEGSEDVKTEKNVDVQSETKSSSSRKSLLNDSLDSIITNRIKKYEEGNPQKKNINDQAQDVEKSTKKRKNEEVGDRDKTFYMKKERLGGSSMEGSENNSVGSPKKSKYFKKNIETDSNDDTEISSNKQNSKKPDEEGYINGIKLSTLQLSSINGLIVTLPFEPHPVHMIETKLTNRPTPNQWITLKELGMQSTNRCYNLYEDQTIRDNWKEFCARHTLDENARPFLVKSSYLLHDQRVKFVRYLARGLEHRTLASVYRRFRSLSVSINKGKFSKEEDDTIREYMATVANSGYSNKHTRIFAKLAEVLNRDRLQIEKHCKKIAKQDKSQLTRADCDQVIKALLHVLGKEDVNELEDYEITLDNWKQLEKLMNHSYNHLKSFWRHTLYPKLFYEGDRDAFSMRNDITQMLIEENITDWRVVDWEKIAKDFKGQTSEALYKSYKTLVYRNVPKSEWDNLEACIAHLINNYFSSYKRQRDSTVGVLKRIIQAEDGVYKFSTEQESHNRSVPY